MWWPGAGNDPFYLANTDLNQTRNNYYGNNYTPHMFTGGNDSGSGPSTWSSNALSMIGNDTPVTIELGGGIDGYDVEVSVSISSESSMASDNTVLIVAATVDSVHYSGPNGLPDHHSTIAGFLTAHTGDQITLDGSNDVIMDYVWSMDEDWPNNSTVTWDIDNLNIVAFVQNYTTKEILQVEGGRVNNMNNDSDEDGVANSDDNCPEAYNPDQADIDSDGFGDACDACDNENVYVTGNINGDVLDNEPVIDIFDVLLLLDLILEDNFPGCTGEVADFNGDNTFSFLDAIFLGQSILNPDGGLVGGFDGGQGRVEVREDASGSVILMENEQRISGFQIDVSVEEIKLMDQLIVPTGWVIKSRQVDGQLRIVGIDLSGENPQDEIYLTIPGNVNGIDQVDACCPLGQQIQFDNTSPVKIGLPKTVKLGQLYPNPFNPTVSIPFSLPSEMSAKVVIYDLQGREVETLLDRRSMTAGSHSLNWNASAFASGIYFVRIETTSGTDVRKAYLVK